MKDADTFDDRYGTAKEMVAANIKHALSTVLADIMGRKLAELSKEELGELASSFAFENCSIDQRRVEIIKKYGYPKL